MKIKQFKMRASAADLLLVKPTGNYIQIGVSAGTLTHLQKWLLQQIRGRQSQIYAKSIMKGHLKENDSLKRMAKKFGIPELLKNEQYYENQYFCGTPDTPLFPYNAKKTVADAKSAKNEDTMPYWGSPVLKKNETQVQVYMELMGAEQGFVCYCLENPTEQDLDWMARQHCILNGYDEVNEEVWEEVMQIHGMDVFPDEMRIVSFPVTPDPAIIEQLQNGVIACRKALETVVIPQFEKVTGLKIEVV